MEKVKRRSGFRRYILSFLIALELLMSFTFLGYIHIPPISITFAYIPVLIGACVLGPAETTILGAVFGLASMYKASSNYVMANDKIFSPFMSGLPLESFLLSVGSRVLFGLVIGLVFWAAKKRKAPRVWLGIASFLAPRFQAFLVYGAMGLFFPETGYHFASAWAMGWSDLPLAVICMLLTELAWDLHYSWKPMKEFVAYVEKSRENERQKKILHRAWGIFMVLIIFCATVIVLYFAERMFVIMNSYGWKLSDDIRQDFVRLQIQSLLAVLSLDFIMALSLLCVYKYMAYREYLVELDYLTGVMGRKLFFRHCENLKKKYQEHPEKEGWFLFVDVDHFKEINDAFGHPVGDQVLQQIAKTLQESFADCGEIGRTGGDEFNVILEEETEIRELQKWLDEFLKSVSGAFPSIDKLTCSIGGCRFAYGQPIEDVYTKADQLLYEAKKRVRNCYVLGKL